jgi:ubiquinone/menaquinone biosynthesis C-methylase UbiE
MDIYNNFDDTVVEQLTKKLISQGTTIFQIWRKGNSDEKHCQWLLDLAEFPLGASVLDIACGVGEVAAQMSVLRPDLLFSLQNISPSQLALCPSGFPQFQGDMDLLAEVPSGVFDAAMICYALGHVKDIKAFMGSVARVLKPGGMFFVYDIQAIASYEGWMWNEFGYRTYTVEHLADIVWSRRLFSKIHIIENVRETALNCDEFLARCPERTLSEMYTRTKPVGYRFVKSKQVS